MRIAMVAPLREAIPPALHGGAERAVSVLTEELVRRGHDVLLFAAGDSRTSAKLVGCVPRACRPSAGGTDLVAATMAQLAQVYELADEFDLIHNHVGYLALPFARSAPAATLTTTHGDLARPEVTGVYASFPEQPLVATSGAQRAVLPAANWLGTVPNGVDVERFSFHPDPGQYLVFVGRIGPEKRLERAIDVAREVGIRLVIAGWVDPVDQAYYDHALVPLLESCPLVEDVGEVDEAEKDELLGGAYAFIHPADPPGSSGLALLEAMATGTPVVAYQDGAPAEAVVDGVTGFTCASTSEMVEAVERAGRLSRWACRAYVEEGFSPAVLADSYERLYAELLEGVDLAQGNGAEGVLVTPFAMTS